MASTSLATVARVSSLAPEGSVKGGARSPSQQLFPIYLYTMHRKSPFRTLKCELQGSSLASSESFNSLFAVMEAYPCEYWRIDNCALPPVQRGGLS